LGLTKEPLMLPRVEDTWREGKGKKRGRRKKY